MESNERDLICYNLLCDVFIDNAYASLQLNNCLEGIKDERDKAYISNLFYGVLEKNVQLDYIMRRIVPRKPKTSIELLIKIGLYHMRFMSTPPYAAINETVQLTKRVGKTGISGFVNAVLRRSATVELPSEDGNKTEYLSANFSVPHWVCQKLMEQYGYEFTKEFLSYSSNKLTHIRYNSRVISREEFEEQLGKDFTVSLCGGYYVKSETLKKLKKSTYTIQSLSSMIATQCYLAGLDFEAPVVLDLCGAPGGKAIYLEELCDKATIYCCDLHPHRVELIKKYAMRMKSNIRPLLSDASIIFPEWINMCDMVLCDVPCSGLGVYKNKPDILFNKKPSDIEKLRRVQLNILDNARNYVKIGGVLCYSTCTVFKEENENNINEFLKNNTNFELDKINSPYASDDGMVHLFPHKVEGSDGFFVARLRRTK